MSQKTRDITGTIIFIVLAAIIGLAISVYVTSNRETTREQLVEIIKIAEEDPTMSRFISNKLEDNEITYGEYLEIKTRDNERRGQRLRDVLLEKLDKTLQQKQNLL